MNDISGKVISLRTARGAGFVYCSEATLDRIRAGELPKGNFFDTARAAGLLAAKQTQHLLPHCHPVPIDGFQLDFELQSGERPGIQITAEARSVSRTGIEMEVLTAISVTALCMYDMLKPVDAQLEIGGVRLLAKTGGRSQARASRPAGLAGLEAAVLVSSDRAAAGQASDESGPAIAEIMHEQGLSVREVRIVPDEPEQIRAALQEWTAAGVPFIFTSGGTGPGPRDCTADVVSEFLQKELPGVAEAMRRFGQDRTQMAMFARQVAGIHGETLMVALPGSPRAVRESLAAILPALWHARSIVRGSGDGDHAPRPSP